MYLKAQHHVCCHLCHCRQKFNLFFLIFTLFRETEGWVNARQQFTPIHVFSLNCVPSQCFIQTEAAIQSTAALISDETGHIQGHMTTDVLFLFQITNIK